MLSDRPYVVLYYVNNKQRCDCPGTPMTGWVVFVSTYSDIEGKPHIYSQLQTSELGRKYLVYFV